MHSARLTRYSSLSAVFALVLLPPFNHLKSPLARSAIRIARTGLAVTATVLFARLPLRYYVPWSCGLTYILSLTGWYGASRVVDVFFITSRNRIPRRVRRKLKTLDDPDSEVETSAPGTPQPLPDSKGRRRKNHPKPSQLAALLVIGTFELSISVLTLQMWITPTRSFRQGETRSCPAMQREI